MQTRSTWGLFAVVCTIFGTTFLAIRVGILSGASAFLSAGLRFTIAGLLMTLWVVARKGKEGRFLKDLLRLLPRCTLGGLFMTVLAFGCMYQAERSVDSGFMARLEALGPLMAAVFSGLMLGKRFTPLHGAGLGLGMIGMVLLAKSPSGTLDTLTLLAALGGVVFYVFGTVLYARLFTDSEDTVTVNGLQMLLGGIMLLMLSALFETPQFPLNTGTLGSLLYLVIAGSIIAHTANMVVIRRGGPVFASAWLYVSPPLASLAGWVVLGEAMGWEALGGTVLAFGGVFLMNRAEHKPPAATVATTASAAPAVSPAKTEISEAGEA